MNLYSGTEKYCLNRNVLKTEQDSQALPTPHKTIPISKPSLTDLEAKYVADALQSGWISSLGEYLNRFEESFAAYCGTQYALTTSSGTTALHLALLGYGIGSGDEVIIPDLTFVATANAVTYTGAKVVLIDIEEETLGIDPAQIEKAITEKTKVIIPVHLYGHPANTLEINRLAQKYNLLVIEDAAEAHGAEVKGQKTGSLGHCGVFSFYGNKIVTCGEGGMITTNDREFYLRAKHLRDHAMSASKRYWHDVVGYNYRMTNLQAALGMAQLERIEEILAKKRAIFQAYHSQLSKLSGIKLNCNAEWASNVFWLVCLEVEHLTEEKRNQFMEELKQYGIDSRPYFYPISDLPMYRADTNYTPVSHQVAKRGINLPSYFDLTSEEIDYICDVVRTKIMKLLEDDKHSDR